MEKFIEGIGKAEALISKEVIRRYGGFYFFNFFHHDMLNIVEESDKVSVFG